MKHYTKQMREWAAAHRANGQGVAASDLECAAGHMDDLIDENARLKMLLDKSTAAAEEARIETERKRYAFNYSQPYE